VIHTTVERFFVSHYRCFFESRIITLPINLVIVDRSLPNDDILQVYVDNLEGAMEAVEHLIKLGHKRIGFISGPRDVLNSLRREEGYCEALKKHHIPVDQNLIITGDFHYQSGYESFDSFMKIEPMPTAIFASNDLMAFGLIQRARERGFHIPNDFSMVGFDDILLSTLINPPLTTIRHPMLEMGTKAVVLLLDQFDKKEEKLVANGLKNTLVVRKSIKPIKE